MGFKKVKIQKLKREESLVLDNKKYNTTTLVQMVLGEGEAPKLTSAHPDSNASTLTCIDCNENLTENPCDINDRCRELASCSLNTWDRGAIQFTPQSARRCKIFIITKHFQQRGKPKVKKNINF